MNKSLHQEFTVTYSFPVVFTRDVFNKENLSIASLLKGSGEKINRMLVVVDSHVFESTPKFFGKIECYAKHHKDTLEITDAPLIIQGGEQCKKDMSEVDRIHELIERLHLCRHSFVLAIGGGAVLDAVGYAAATAHRGIRLLRMPTTVLAQNDAGVGVKNGINAFGRKNFLGTFCPPFAIINDFDFLKTLPARDLRAGIAEAVKVALIKDSAFFDFLYRERHRLAAFEPSVMEKMIVRCAELHLEHIRTSRDPFEYGSSRPLDFGHWSAHKIEEITNGDVKHGEAVAIGTAIDSLYSFHKGLISETGLHKVLKLLEDLGFDLYHWSLGWLDTARALDEFREHLGGKLTVALLNGIGDKTDAHEIDINLLGHCINTLADRAKGKETGNGRSKPDVRKANSGHLLH